MYFSITIETNDSRNEANIFFVRYVKSSEKKDERIPKLPSSVFASKLPSDLVRGNTPRA